MSLQPTATPLFWWTISQAIAWIVTRDEDQAAGSPDVASLDQLPPLTPNQFLERPPIPKTDAAWELLRAWDEGTVNIFGAKNGHGEPIAVPKPKYKFTARFLTHQARLWLELRLEVGSGPMEFWTSLAVRPAHCKATWPPTPLPSNNRGRPSELRDGLEVWLEANPDRLDDKIPALQAAMKTTASDKTIRQAVKRVRGRQNSGN